MGDSKCVHDEEITQTGSVVVDSCANSNEVSVQLTNERESRIEGRADGGRNKLFFRRSGLNPKTSRQRHGNSKSPTTREGRVTERIEGGTMPLSGDVCNKVEKITTKRKKKKKKRPRRPLHRTSRSPTSRNGLLCSVAVSCSDPEETASVASDATCETSSSSHTSRNGLKKTSPLRLNAGTKRLVDNGRPFDSQLDSSPSSPCPSPSAASDLLRYGDEIRLSCYSAFEKSWLYLGYSPQSLKRSNAKAVGKGDLFMLPPGSKSRVFHESAFTVIDPLDKREDGEPLCYGDVLTLADERGKVWNNKSGRLHGLLGPSTYGYGGQMHMTLSQKVETEEEVVGCKRGEGDEEVKEACHSNARDGKILGNQVHYGDNFLVFAKKLRAKKCGIVRSAVTHKLRKKYGGQCGAFLRSDGRGLPLLFCVHRAPPRISTVTIFGQGRSGDQTGTYYKVPWEQELELNIPCGLPGVNSLFPPTVTPKSMNDKESTTMYETQNNKPFLCDHGWVLPHRSSEVICVTLSNGGKVVLELQDLMNVGGTVDKYKWFNITDCTEEFRLKIHVRCLDAGDGNKGAAIWTFFIAALVACIISTALKALLIFFSSSHFWRVVGELSVSGKAMWLSLEIASVCMTMLLASSFKDLMEKKKGGLGFTVVHGSGSHCYVASFIKCETGRAEDAPPDDGGLESSIPPIFMEAEKGDLEKAKKRWKDTLEWRAQVSADEALITPHYTFDICKRFYPTAFHGVDKRGAIVYFERLGGVNIKEVRDQGLTSESLIWHYIWQMEYLWTHISPTYDGKVTIILDMEGVHVGDLKGEVSNFIRATVSMLERHYPARSDCIFIINVPWWFDAVWKIVKPLLHKGTRSKIHINPCNQARIKDALLKVVDKDELPKEYGGSSLHELHQHPMEIDMRKYAVKIIDKGGLREMDEVTTECNILQGTPDQKLPMNNREKISAPC